MAGNDLCLCGHGQKAHSDYRRGAECALCPCNGFRVDKWWQPWWPTTAPRRVHMLCDRCCPHGPNEPCTCDGCWACAGHVTGCTCDIAWDCDHG